MYQQDELKGIAKMVQLVKCFFAEFLQIESLHHFGIYTNKVACVCCDHHHKAI